MRACPTGPAYLATCGDAVGAHGRRVFSAVVLRDARRGRGGSVSICWGMEGDPSYVAATRT